MHSGIFLSGYGLVASRLFCRPWRIPQDLRAAALDGHGRDPGVHSVSVGSPRISEPGHWRSPRQSGTKRSTDGATVDTKRGRSFYFFLLVFLFRHACVIHSLLLGQIFHFGGDPDSVTLMGSSAGAYSTLFQMVSPHNLVEKMTAPNANNKTATKLINSGKPLFHKIISHSGSPISDQYLRFGKPKRWFATKMAKKVGCVEKKNDKKVSYFISDILGPNPFICY